MHIAPGVADRDFIASAFRGRDITTTIAPMPTIVVRASIQASAAAYGPVRKTYFDRSVLVGMQPRASVRSQFTSSSYPGAAHWQLMLQQETAQFRDRMPGLEDRKRACRLPDPNAQAIRSEPRICHDAYARSTYSEQVHAKSAMPSTSPSSTQPQLPSSECVGRTSGLHCINGGTGRWQGVGERFGAAASPPATSASPFAPLWTGNATTWEDSR